MSELITLAELKAHCRIDGDLDDALLTTYLAAALEACQQHTGKRFSSAIGDGGIEFNPALKAGCLLFAAQLYEYREAVTDARLSEVPLAISRLWSAYRDPGVY